jgi:hypothetical protein
VQLTDRVAMGTGVICREVGQETVLLDLGSGEYFGLNAVGARVWQLLGEHKTLADVCTALAMEYDMTPAEVQPDVLRLAEELDARRLISVAP